MLLAMAGLKGGTGRTTLTLSIGCEAIARGHRVVIVDADPRRDATAWATMAKVETPAILALSGASLPPPRGLRELARGYDLVLVDLPADKAAHERVFDAADLAMVPCAPSPFELWSTLDTLAVAQERRGLGARLQCAVLPNRLDRSSLSDALPRDLRRSGAPVMVSGVRRRVAHPEALAQGMVARAFAPDSSACQDISDLVDELEGLRPRMESFNSDRPAVMH